MMHIAYFSSIMGEGAVRGGRGGVLCCPEGDAVQGEMLFITGSDIITTPSCGQTNASENITLPHTSFAGGNNNTFK